MRQAFDEVILMDGESEQRLCLKLMRKMMIQAEYLSMVR